MPTTTKTAKKPPADASAEAEAVALRLTTSSVRSPSTGRRLPRGTVVIAHPDVAKHLTARRHARPHEGELAGDVHHLDALG